MWPVKLDLSRISYAALRTAVAPILPGGLVALACLFMRDGPAARLISSPSIGYYTKVAIVVFMAYVVGFVIHIGVFLASVMVVSVLKELLRARLYPGEPWNDKQWRMLAQQLIGEHLLPTAEQPPDKQPTATDTPQFRAMLEAGRQATKRILEDYEWSWWYGVVRSYFYKFDPSSGLMLVEFSGVLQSIGWAGIIVLLKCVPGSLFLWVACVLVVVTGMTGCFIGVVAFDATAPNVAAEMLHELKQESRHRSTPNA